MRPDNATGKQGKKRPLEEVGIGSRLKRPRLGEKTKFTIVKKRHISNFRTTVSSYKINLPSSKTSDLCIDRILTDLLSEVTKEAKGKDFVQLVIEAQSISNPIFIPFLKLSTLTPERLIEEIELKLQSKYEEFVLDSGLIVKVTLVDMPSGGSRKRCKYVDIKRFKKEKRCILQIKNDDDLCCARAIVTAKEALSKGKNWNNIRLGRSTQKLLAEELHKNAGVAHGVCGKEELEKFQKVLPAVQLHVVLPGGIYFYKGPTNLDKKIFLLLHSNHFDVITSMAAFSSRNYYCTACYKGYDHKEKHRCNNVCSLCKKIHSSTDSYIKHTPCKKCLRSFKGNTCFELHAKETASGNSTCNTFYKCKKCEKTVNKNMDTNHCCGQVFCKTCRKFHPEGHLCYMMPIEEKKKTQRKTFIFFDFECLLEDQVQCDAGYDPGDFGKCKNCCMTTCGAYEHLPNLCVTHRVCTDCMDEEEACTKCYPREHIFKGATTRDDFCTWLFSGENNESTVICHNFQGYDSYPIVQYLYENNANVSILPDGAKIKSLTVKNCNITMIDSVNFLPMTLAEMPATFNFKELKKGYFPHLFNRRENELKVLDKLPLMEYYNSEGMMPENREHFLEWYALHKNDKFDLQKELLAYCQSDVDILRHCTLRFRKEFIDITKIDPFDRPTISSACSQVFRSNFIQKNTIGLIPHNGYPNQNTSKKAITWLMYMSEKRACKIQHARNGKEKQIGKYLVDGYYQTKDGEKVVLEFLGDYWHGNPAKYDKSHFNKAVGETMGDLYARAAEKKRCLEDQGYIYDSIWESEFDKMCKDDHEMRKFMEKTDLATPLEPHEAFFGGRTEAFTLYKKATVEEDIDYYDVISLYPWVNKTGKIPVGHPDILTENIGSLEEYEGLIKCKVLPPKGLFMPVLPCRVNKKLLFHLCKVCAADQQLEKCCHSDSERSFEGTWVTDEVKMAVKMGYKVTKIYEVWHFKEISHYDHDNNTDGLFTKYVNTFLKLKQEASGWPEECDTEEKKCRYIDSYEQAEGIRLDREKIGKNPGRRAIAKLMLNSFWGKFGQKPCKKQVEKVCPEGFFKILDSKDNVVTDVNFINDNSVELRFEKRDESAKPGKSTNIIIAAYTTAQARLKLYSFLEELGSRALYCDTDSVIFSTKKASESKLPLGSNLGDLSDEVAIDRLPDEVSRNRITEFATGGPKTYGYKLERPSRGGNLTRCKVKGITLNWKNISDVNFDRIKEFVRETPNASVALVDSNRIARDRNTKKIVTRPERKTFRLTFDKRVIGDKYVSYPFGF